MVPAVELSSSVSLAEDEMFAGCLDETLTPALGRLDVDLSRPSMVLS